MVNNNQTETKQITFDENNKATVKIGNNESVDLTGILKDTLATISINGSLKEQGKATKTIVTTEDGQSVLTVPKAERKNLKLEPHIICAYFRIGNNGKCVDNFNSGGMVAPVDEITGIVSQVAIDKQKNVYEKHPATGEKIKGFKFPYWEEAIDMCKEACQEIPDMGYVGWDVAFTPDGPVFVEGNEFPGHDIYQLPEHTPDKIGMMPKFDFSKKENKKLQHV